MWHVEKGKMMKINIRWHVILSGCLLIQSLFSAQMGEMLTSNLLRAKQRWPKYNMIAKQISTSDQATWEAMVAGIKAAVDKLEGQKKSFKWYDDVKDAVDATDRISSELFPKLAMVYSTYIQPAIKRTWDRATGIDVNFDVWWFDCKALAANANQIKDIFSPLLDEVDDLKKIGKNLEDYESATTPAGAPKQQDMVVFIMDIVDFLYEKLDLLQQNVDSLADLAS